MTTPTLEMPMQPSYGPTKKDVQFDILKAEFGDGYSQRAADGINNSKEMYDVGWDSLTIAEANDIEAFIRARKGYESFFISSYDRESTSTRKFTCQKMSRKPAKPGYDSITLTLEEVKDL